MHSAIDWRRAVTLAHVVRLGLRAPRGVTASWNRYWSEVRTTGDDGDVLWDTTDPAEADRYLALLAEHAAPELPIVDIGCGNGRFTRAIAEHFPRALGVDLSPAAIARARRETPELAGGQSPDHTGERPGDLPTAGGPDQLTFQVLDLTVPGVGRTLRAELGPANVFVRGVLHVLPAPARRQLAANVADLVGHEGTVLLAETNHRGPLLRYLESLGAGPRGLPAPLARAISTGIPRPHPFGAAELADCFPVDRWTRVVEDEDTTITTIPLRQAGVHDLIPGFVAVLRG